jgi:hypothetical protein
MVKGGRGVASRTCNTHQADSFAGVSYRGRGRGEGWAVR